ncbi:YncE family protein [Polaribacter sargassicola]|uniref:YncE family protein n=1 Tax=Polaribacter sargassicola TaxID=2836891 RepID=UPI001F15F2F4|nr:DUF5074 domain-containing protein [Polaribacter sp. DS7-9]MCG1036476.1 cell surface protein [Polaribacter sp. DS7-9]
MKINKLLSLLLLATILFASCEKDSVDLPKGDYENGVLISGEGSGAGTGSISFVSDDFVTSENLIYKTVNNEELGTFLQSMTFDNDNAYIVVDNQNTVTVADRYTFEKLGSINTGLILPRFIAVVGNKGYVTNWGSTSSDTDDFIAVVNLETYEVESTISVGNGPERIIENNGKLYVSHKGAYTTNNVISVIDIDSEEVIEITVKDNPDELFFNNLGELVVLSSGRTIYDTDWSVIGTTLASISMIDITSLEITNELVFAEGEQPSLMVFENGAIYYNIGNSVYVINESATSLSSTSIVETEGFLYGLEVEGDNLYTLDASFSDSSKLNIYSISSGSVSITKDVAIGASKIYFN